MESYYERNKEKKKQYQKEYRKKNPNKFNEWKDKHKKEVLEYQKNYNRINNIKKSNYQKGYSKRHPEIVKAQNKAKYKIPLRDKCEYCGSIEKLERHHPDYSKPLEVITLCKICHTNEHK